MTATPQEAPVIRVDVGTFSPPVLLDVAVSTGRVAEAGLEVTEHPVASSPAQFRDLRDGGLQVGLTSPDNVLAYRFDPANPLGERLDARIVAAVDRALGLGLYARPGLGPADLRGARIGVDVPHSGFAVALYALAERLGVHRSEYDVVPLGSTPKRLEALLAGECDATMLNAGNELRAEHAGCPLLASAVAHLAPYLGTVVAVVGDAHLAAARALADALVATSAEVRAGRLDDLVVEAAGRRLGLEDAGARAHLARLRDPGEGLVAEGEVDHASLANLAGLRRTWLPSPVDGQADAGDVMDQVLDPVAVQGSGLVDVR